MREMTLAEQVTFDAMIAQHQRIRARLPMGYQQDLGQLTVQVRTQLFAELPRGNVLACAAQIVSDVISALTTREAASLAEYALGGIAAGDNIGAAVGPSRSSTLTNAMLDMQARFNMQYLQLQVEMQNENRQYSMISNILKTKHDTVKCSINNIR